MLILQNTKRHISEPTAGKVKLLFCQTFFPSVTNVLCAHANPIHHFYPSHEEKHFPRVCVFYFCQHCCSYGTRETTLMDTLVNVGKVLRDEGIHPSRIGHSFLCRPLPCPLCLSRLTHTYDNLYTSKSPNGPWVCRYGSMINKSDAVKSTRVLRCSSLQSSKSRKKLNKRHLKWMQRIWS